VSALTHYFFDAVYRPRSAWSVVSWWEARRPVYNLVVGAAGLTTVAAVTLVNALPPFSNPMAFPWVGALIYAIVANVCYSLGPAADLIVRRLWGDDYAAVGPTLFRYGFVFAVGVTLLPIPLVIAGWVIRIVVGL
jgi:hypothetical protein